jgi:hypothetical protein
MFAQKAIPSGQQDALLAEIDGSGHGWRGKFPAFIMAGRQLLTAQA